MSDRGYIGILTNGVVTARYLHWADGPDILIPTLRCIWDGFGRDSDAMAAALLAEDWSRLSADRQRTGPCRIVPGVGQPSPGGTRARTARIRLAEPIGAWLGWLYVVDPDTDTVTVYEATVHDRWLRHSVHELPTTGTAQGSYAAALVPPAAADRGSGSNLSAADPRC